MSEAKPASSQSTPATSRSTRAKSQSTTVPRVRIRRLIDAPRAEVFAAWTDAEAMGYWMRPGPMSEVRCDLDVREGGRYRIVMAGHEGERWEHEGEYRVVDSPNKLVFTWISNITDGRETVVTIELFERSDRTELVLTHEELPHEKAVEMHKRGWTTIVDTLSERIAADGETADGGAGRGA